MIQKWPTKSKDVKAAQQIMEEYAQQHKLDSLGLFELVVDPDEKKMDFRLSPWVSKVALYFQGEYGDKQGDRITRQVISYCITKNETIH